MDKERVYREDDAEENVAAEPEESASAEEEVTAEEGEEEASESLLSWVAPIVETVLGVILVFLFVLPFIVVEGPSMQHTLYDGDMVVILRRPLYSVEAGDVVMVHHYNSALKHALIKRVVAVEGQTVDIDFLSGTVYVDGEVLEEDYIAERTHTDEGMQFPLTLGEGEVFLMGDNRNYSTDSRSPALGVVDERYVIGKAVFLAFPGKTAQYTGELPGTGARDFSRIGLIR